MSISKHEEKMITLQQQVKENQLDLHDYLADLNSWTSDIAVKDEALGKHQVIEQPKLPPVRNSLDKKKRKKIKKKQQEHAQNTEKTKRISGYDYRAWDKFDIEKACNDMEGNSSSEYETDDEWEMERKQHLAEKEKEDGNEHLKKGKYELAVESYTRGIDLDPSNAIIPANRAMAFLKLQMYAEAAVDCTTAISLDPLYVKAYLRRASARLGQHKLQDALADYERILTLEPQNKHAKSEIIRVKKVLSCSVDGELCGSSFESSEKGVVKPVYKPIEQRSKKPLKRLIIEEIGQGKNTEQIEGSDKVSANASKAKKPFSSQNVPLVDTFTSRNTVSTGHTNPQFPISSNGTEEHCRTDASDSLKTDGGLNSRTTSIQAHSNMERNGGINSCSTVQLNSDTEMETPQTSFQFQASYKILKNNPKAFYNYFKKIKPSNLSKLFGQYLDADNIMKIFMSFKDFFIPDGLDVFPFVQQLATVDRFDVAVMFLSAKEKQVFQEVFDHLRIQSSTSSEALDILAKKYQLL